MSVDLTEAPFGTHDALSGVPVPGKPADAGLAHAENACFHQL